MRQVLWTTLVFVSLSFGGTTHAALLIDTGPGPATQAGLTLYAPGKPPAGPFQYLGGQFTLGQAADITSVNGWIGVFSSGRMKVAIHKNKLSTDMPGKTLRSRSFLVPDVGTSDNTGHWQAFAGLDWHLNAGTYWITLEPVPTRGFSGVAPVGQLPLADPLSKYALLHTGSSTWSETPLQIGFQIYGNQIFQRAALVPEPSSSLLLGAGLIALIGVCQARRRGSK